VEGETGDDVDTKLSELRSVVAYLRKEKEIVDLQLELSKQENGRLKAQIDHLSQNLEETRTALSEARFSVSFSERDADSTSGTRPSRGSRKLRSAAR
jgi:chromosome segregation ATPase